MKREFKIGAFIAMAFFIMALFIFVVGDLGVIFERKGYPLFARFDSVAGLEKRAMVRMAGVKAGYVEEIRLEGNKARVKMSLYPGLRVPRDSKATLASLGLLGEKYIEIVPGESAEHCRPQETIQGLPPVNMDQIGSLLLSIGEEISHLGEGLASRAHSTASLP